MTIPAARAAIEAVRRTDFTLTPVPHGTRSVADYQRGFIAGYNTAFEDALIALDVIERGPTEGAS